MISAVGVAIYIIAIIICIGIVGRVFSEGAE